MFKNTLLLSFLLFVFVSCEKDQDPINYSNSYGNGTYILSTNGLNFIKKNTNNIKSQIFSSVVNKNQPFTYQHQLRPASANPKFSGGG